MVDLPDLAEGAVSKFDNTVVADRKPAIGITRLPIAALAGSLGSKMKVA